jgi:hypothetical protein
MDSASGSQSANSVQWKFIGENVPRAKIVHFVQLFLCLTLIITSAVMLLLALKDPNCDFWMITLSFLVGYVMSSPQVGSIKQPTTSTNSSVHRG